jgi:hypothetical protein
MLLQTLSFISAALIISRGRIELVQLTLGRTQ